MKNCIRDTEESNDSDSCESVLASLRRRTSHSFDIVAFLPLLRNILLEST